MKPLALFVSLLLLASTTTPAAELTAKDIAALKKLCEALVGIRTDSDQWTNALTALRVYAESSVIFESFHFVCDGSRCSGMIRLRDSSDIYVSFAQNQDFAQHGSGSIDTVRLRNRGKTVFSVGGDGGRDSHKRADDASNDRADAEGTVIFETLKERSDMLEALIVVDLPTREVALIREAVPGLATLLLSTAESKPPRKLRRSKAEISITVLEIDSSEATILAGTSLVGVSGHETASY